jgi:dipeptidyl aminopeptidase/acylaminoacyl peptidase
MIKITHSMIRITAYTVGLAIMVYFGLIGLCEAQTVKGEVIAQWQVKAEPEGLQWSPKSDQIIYHYAEGEIGVIERYTLQPPTRAILTRSKNGFFPCFGPMGSVFVGPQSDPPLPKMPIQKPDQKDHNHWIHWKSGLGVHIYAEGEKSFLFPGYQPLYHHEARRLLFSYRGILYIWDPMRSRSKGLLLLTKGYQPQWSPDGRAIAFLRQPFAIHPHKGISGGGIQVVDMLFKVAFLTKTGGQVSWSFDSRSLLYVDSISALPDEKRKKISAAQAHQSIIYHIPLGSKQSQSHKLLTDAWQPNFYSGSDPKMNWIFAYTDAQGVWLMHLVTRKRVLIAPHASKPTWSPRGDLLVYSAKDRRLIVLHISKKLVSRLDH